MFQILSRGNWGKRSKRFYAYLLVFALLLGIPSTCAAATGPVSEMELDTVEAVLCVIDQDGFKVQAKNSEVRVLKDEKTEDVYYNLADFTDLIGYTWQKGVSQIMYSNIGKDKRWSPCILIDSPTGSYELFERYFLLIQDGGSGRYSYNGCDDAFFYDGETPYVKGSVLEAIYGAVLRSDGDIYFLNPSGRTYPGTRGLTQKQSAAIANALFLLYVKDKEDYDTLMRYGPSFTSVTASEIRAACGWMAGAYTNFDWPVIRIRTDIFDMQRDLFAALLVHESYHWVVGWNTLDTEGIPTEQQIRCLIRLGASHSDIQAQINSAMTRSAYQYGARRGQLLLDAEMGRELAERCFLPINEDFYGPLFRLSQ